MCAMVDHATLATPENLIHNTITIRDISRKKNYMASKMSVKRNSIKATHMRTL